ncbi:O-acyltransferase WSD1 [Sesamum alatum]|uniref:O-acyltransferase WSD1 n=1 Tax=Sesamum alatum TaxID=300844 RepID=A0AAE1YJF8_9LAMI|nr:O-acyltransferase WSD1 [Sesamum alatum]
MSLNEEPASPTARLMQAPSFNLCILALLGYSTMIDVNLFKKCLEQTLLKHPRSSSLFVVNDKDRGKWSWRRTRVDLENHVFVPDLDPDMQNPDGFVEDFTAGLSRIPLDYAKPLWEVHILNVKTSDANSVVIFKIHHSLGDGVSMISLVLACAKKLSDPESLPVMPSKKPKQKQKSSGVVGLVKRLFVSIWIIFLVVFNTLIDVALFLATILFLKDSKTPIKGGGKVDRAPKRFVHRVISLDDVKLVKNAMNVSINDVVLGVTEAGLSRYLNTTYEKRRENGAEVVMKKTRALPRNLRFRSAVIFNLRPTPSIQDLAEMMEKEELNGMWGNLVALVLLPLTIAVQDDPLRHVRRAKATMDRKKLSLETNIVFIVLKLLIKLFGIKTAAVVVGAVFQNTTMAISNVVGPPEEINLFGHPLCYIAPTVNGFPQALVVHYQTYANKLIICLAADENLIPNPHQLCDDLQQSLQNIKETVMKRGLVKGFPVCGTV